MVHEAKVTTVISSQIIEVVAEGLAFGKVLLVGAEARIHRMAAHVDDDGIRQNAIYQAYVAEVVRHLIDEMRPAAAQRRCLLQVPAAHRPKLPNRYPLHPPPVRVVRGIPL